MSSLSLAQNNSLQDRKEKQAMRAQYRGGSNAPSDPMRPLVPAQTQQQPPLAAPQPTRAPVAPMGPSQPAPAAQLPNIGGTWNPDMGIRFGGGPSAPPPAGAGTVHNPAYPNTRLGGQWSPSRGLKFG